MGLAASIVVSLRPRQWVKNLFVFAAVIFSQQLFTPLIWRAGGAFVIFCGLSGAIYLVNDVADRDKDACTRPSGTGPSPRARSPSAWRSPPRRSCSPGASSAPSPSAPVSAWWRSPTPCCSWRTRRGSSTW